MASPFLLALHTTGNTPRALALVERATGADGPEYVVRALRSLTGNDPLASALDLLAAEPQLVARTILVTTGGQRAADAVRLRGPSAAAVALTDLDGPGGSDAHAATSQELVNTFQRLYRAGVVHVPGTLDAASGAVQALARAADLDAAVDDADDSRDAGTGSDETGTTVTLTGDRIAGEGPAPTRIQQSGGQAALSTERIGSRRDPREATAASVAAAEGQARTSGASAGATPDLGEHADTALALALALWFAETTRDTMPLTDMADEALAARRR